MTISAELSGALRYCGDIEGERINLPDLYQSWLNACALLDADLQLSPSWRNLLVTPAFQIGQQEQPLPQIENFSFEVGLDRRAVGVSTNPWRTVSIVAPERVSDAQSIGTWFAQAGYLQSSANVASFYGEPRNIILGFDPSPYEFRLWYVPQTPADRTNQSGLSGLPETYAPLRSLLTAHERLVDCKYEDAIHDRYERVILQKLAIWQPTWGRFKNKPLKREGSRRPGYKATMRRRR